MKKTCKSCGEPKELNPINFHKNKKLKDGYWNICKSCRKKQDQKRYYDNRDKILEDKKKYYEENKDFITSKQNAYYYENQEVCRNREKRWRLNNPHKRRVINERRRTRERNLPSTLSTEEWVKTKRFFNNSCVYCGMSEKDHLKENGELLHQEHFIPLEKFGIHDKFNIIPSCRSCNSSKANKDFSEWYPTSKSYDRKRTKKILEYMIQ